MSPRSDSKYAPPPAPARRSLSWQTAARYVQHRIDGQGRFGGLKRLAPEAFATRLHKRLTNPARPRALYKRSALPRVASAAARNDPDQAQWEQGVVDLALNHTVHASSNPYGTDQAHLEEGFDFFNLNDLPGPECIHGLNRCRWFISLARGYWLNQDPALFTALMWHWDFYTRHVADPDLDQMNSLHAISPLVTQSPPYRSLNSYVRLTSWWHAFWLSIHAPEMTPHRMVTLLAHCLKLLDYVHAHGVRRQEHNFTSMQMEGLYFWALSLPEFSGMNALAVMARNSMEFSLARAILPDGLQWEMSISYHAGCIGWYGGPALLGQRLGQPWSPMYLEYLQNMGDVLDQLVEHDGQVVPLSDSDGHTNWSKGLSILTQLFPDRTYLNQSPPDFSTTWLTAGHLHKLSKPRKPKSTFKLFPDSRLLVARSKHAASDQTPSSMLVFDNGPSDAGHSHRDQLAVYWRSTCHRALVDPGRWVYRQNDPDRSWVLSMRAHNCLWIAGSPKEEAMDLPPSVADRVSPKDHRIGPVLVNEDTAEQLLHTKATFAGYLADPQARATRKIVLPLSPDEHWLLVVDTFEGTKAHNWVNSWLTPGPTGVARKKNHWQVALDTGATLHCTTTANHKVTTQSHPAFWTPQYGQKSPAQWTRLSGKAIHGVRAHLFTLQATNDDTTSSQPKITLNAQGRVTAQIGKRHIKTT